MRPAVLLWEGIAIGTGGNEIRVCSCGVDWRKKSGEVGFLAVRVKVSLVQVRPLPSRGECEDVVDGSRKGTGSEACEYVQMPEECSFTGGRMVKTVCISAC